MSRARITPCLQKHFDRQWYDPACTLGLNRLDVLDGLNCTPQLRGKHLGWFFWTCNSGLEMVSGGVVTAINFRLSAPGYWFSDIWSLAIDA